MDIGKLKEAGSAFHVYLQANRVYINKAQLGTEEGVTLKWMHRSTRMALSECPEMNTHHHPPHPSYALQLICSGFSFFGAPKERFESLQTIIPRCLEPAHKCWH
jgi:hypothetical protein